MYLAYYGICKPPFSSHPHITIVTPMNIIDFELDHDFIELNQLLKLTGLCDSGGAGKQIVASGNVLVNDAVELRKTAKIRAGQTVTLGDTKIHLRAC